MLSLSAAYNLFDKFIWVVPTPRKRINMAVVKMKKGYHVKDLQMTQSKVVQLDPSYLNLQLPLLLIGFPLAVMLT